MKSQFEGRKQNNDKGMRERRIAGVDGRFHPLNLSGSHPIIGMVHSTIQESTRRRRIHHPLLLSFVLLLFLYLIYRPIFSLSLCLQHKTTESKISGCYDAQFFFVLFFGGSFTFISSGSIGNYKEIIFSPSRGERAWAAGVAGGWTRNEYNEV
jgi:hypothetical protein